MTPGTEKSPMSTARRTVAVALLSMSTLSSAGLAARDYDTSISDIRTAHIWTEASRAKTPTPRDTSDKNDTRRETTTNAPWRQRLLSRLRSPSSSSSPRACRYGYGRISGNGRTTESERSSPKVP